MDTEEKTSPSGNRGKNIYSCLLLTEKKIKLWEKKASVFIETLIWYKKKKTNESLRNEKKSLRVLCTASLMVVKI